MRDFLLRRVSALMRYEVATYVQVSLEALIVSSCFDCREYDVEYEI